MNTQGGHGLPNSNECIVCAAPMLNTINLGAELMKIFASYNCKLILRLFVLMVLMKKVFLPEILSTDMWRLLCLTLMKYLRIS